MEFGEFIKIYGPMGLGWVGFAYLGKFILDRYKDDIDSRVKLATSLDSLANIIEQSLRENGNGAHD